MTTTAKTVSVFLAIFIAAITIVSFLTTPAEAQSGNGQLNVVVTSTGTVSGNPQITIYGNNIGLGSSTGTSNAYTYSPSWNASTAFTMNVGSYAVTLTQMSGYNVNYSTDCFGTMNAGNSRTCIVTVNSTGGVNTGYGLLTVFVNVTNQYGSIRQPSDFTINVSGNNVSQSSFSGSTSGRVITLSAGSYSVTAVGNNYNYATNYSGDCSGTIANNDNRSCTITLQYSGSYNPTYPYNPGYPYNYPYSRLSCTASTQSAYVGQSVTFVAQGGTGTYNWVIGGKTYTNVGPSLTVVVDSGSSPQVASVTSAHETATCYFNVAGYGTGYIGGGIVKGVYTAPGLPYTGEGGDAARAWGMIIGLLVIAPAGLYFAFRFTRRSISSILSSRGA